jgi:uncharacterized protein (UPF0548 family)
VRSMEISGVVVGRRSGAEVGRRLALAEGVASSYPDVGSTENPPAPSGYHGLEAQRVVEGSVLAARRALDRWAAHAGIGARVVPSGAPAQGATVLVVASLGPFEVLAPNRVVAVVDEPHRCGFAYATLPGHPEVGEERFEAVAVDVGRVRLTVRAHSRPADRIGRALGPLVLRLQRAAADRYVRAWAEAIEADAAPGGAG